MVPDAPFVVGVLVCFDKGVDWSSDPTGSSVVMVMVVVVMVVTTLWTLPLWFF